MKRKTTDVELSKCHLDVAKKYIFATNGLASGTP